MDFAPCSVSVTITEGGSLKKLLTGSKRCKKAFKAELLARGSDAAEARFDLPF